MVGEATVATRLREVMAGRSIRGVARRAGVDYHTLRKMAQGQKRGGTVHTIERIALALGVSPGWLAFGEGVSDAG